MKTSSKKAVHVQTKLNTKFPGKLELSTSRERTGERKFLQTLQHSAIDKENLVSAGGNMKDVILETELTEKSTKVGQSIKKSSEKTVATTNSIKDDLINEVASEHYWKILAEKRRVALDEALQENEALHNKVKLLEEENSVVKEMMKEATDLVQTLTEIVQEKAEEEDISFNISK